MAADVSVELDARETDWAFAPDRTLHGFGYNGRVPGPLIEAKAGATVHARLTNNLPQPTTIHWHGLRVPADMDGTESVQPPVEPGGTFDYEFVVPDAGTFWYHSHVNEPELEIAGGQIERWRIVNAANTRFVRLSIGARPLSILGTDGGLLPSPVEA